MSYPSLPARHYSRLEVQREISEFCRGRWVAAHCIDEHGKPIFRRYVDGKPITIKQPKEFLKLMKRLNYKVRSVYATANVYSSIKNVEDVYELSNVSRCTPTWDIDGLLSNWSETIAIAREITSFLEDYGAQKSLYIKWSGNGCHVHIHEGAFSQALLDKHHPLDIAYAIVEYVNLKLSSKFIELSPRGETKVENRIDPRRVFTCPLSLHRELDVVCICMKPNQLDDFSPDWINPSNFKHNTSWRIFMEGEGDELAREAIKTVGGYPLPVKRGRRRKKMRLDEQIMRWLKKT